MSKNIKKLLITGCSGLLGNNLIYYFKNYFDILGLYNSNPVNIEGVNTMKCDLLNKIELNIIIKNYKPKIIIHCAALSNVDQCEIDQRLAKRINIVATKNVVEAIDDSAILIYISTDSVYDGRKGMFSEDDPINPLNYYGITKYKGEMEVLKIERSLVFRTNFYGWNILKKESLVEWIINELKEKQKINCFHDAYFSSMYTFEFAKVVHDAIKKNLRGVYNCGSFNSCSKLEFAQKIAVKFGFDKSLIHPISIEDFSFKAKRAKNQSLNMKKIEKDLGHRLKSIDGSILSCYNDYIHFYPFKMKIK